MFSWNSYLLHAAAGVMSTQCNESPTTPVSQSPEKEKKQQDKA